MLLLLTPVNSDVPTVRLSSAVDKQREIDDYSARFRVVTRAPVAPGSKLFSSLESSLSQLSNGENRFENGALWRELWNLERALLLSMVHAESQRFTLLVERCWNTSRLYASLQSGVDNAIHYNCQGLPD